MVDVLAFGAHPDDCEFACGGILAKMASKGRSIVIVDLTRGDKGSNGTVEERTREGEEAAKILNAKRIYLDFSDCEVIDTYANRLKLVEQIRIHRPRLVLAPLWKGEMTHPDHLACGSMARFACRYARFKNILPDLPPHRITGILHYLFPFQENPDFLIDVSESIELWKKIMAAHGSQMRTNDYSDWNLRMASKYGVYLGVDYAQGLVKGNPIVIDDPLSISQGTFEI